MSVFTLIVLKDKPKEALHEFARQSVPCIGFDTRRGMRLITQYYDRALAQAGLRSTQYSLLSVLAMLGENSMQDLAFVLAMDRTRLPYLPALSRAVFPTPKNVTGTGSSRNRLSARQTGWNRSGASARH